MTTDTGKPGSNTSLAQRAWAIRRNALLMGEVQGQGYIGQALGAADLLAVSYFHAMDYRPGEPEWEGRDRFYLSIGHYAIALYAAMIEAGILPEDEIATYGMDDSRMPMSGMASYTPGMEITGGSLGHGLGIAVGAAMGLKRKGSDRFVYNLLSDGELGEGSTWEAVMSATQWKLDNLIAIVDFNNQQTDGPTRAALAQTRRSALRHVDPIRRARAQHTLRIVCRRAPATARAPARIAKHLEPARRRRDTHTILGPERLRLGCGGQTKREAGNQVIFAHDLSLPLVIQDVFKLDDVVLAELVGMVQRQPYAGIAHRHRIGPGRRNGE